MCGCTRDVENIPRDELSHQAFGRVLHAKLFGHKMEGIEGIDGELYEDGTRGSRLRDGQGFPHSGYDLPDGPNRDTELTQRPEERHLVDVLQRSPALYHKHSRRRF